MERSVRSMSLVAGATVLAATAIGALGADWAARADVNNPALNGRYLATSNGEWAMTNESFHDEATTRSIWTITSSCSTPQDCAGTVTSDQGWTADISFRPATSGGSTASFRIGSHAPTAPRPPAYRNYVFWPSDETGVIDMSSPILTGWDETGGPSGACGWNKTLRDQNAVQARSDSLIQQPRRSPVLPDEANSATRLAGQHVLPGLGCRRCHEVRLLIQLTVWTDVPTGARIVLSRGDRRGGRG